MNNAPVLSGDDLRLKSLHAMQLLSTPAEADFDRITRVVADHFGTPIALFSLIDRDRQWFKSRIGLDVAETPRETSFCGHAILGNDVFVVPDARTDSRFADNPLVTGTPSVAFYAGVPVENEQGHKIGALCVIDHKARTFTPQQQACLRDFGRWAQLAIQNRALGRDHLELLTELDAARRDSMICPLTQAWNRRGLSQLIERELNKAAREETALGFLLLDIDHFKRINDTYGHPVGDRALTLLARILREEIRAYDILARVGGEEFVVALPGTNLAHACQLAEKLRAAVANRAILENGDHFTVSIGVTCFDPAIDGRDETRMMERADKALYRAKHEGRNRVASI
jgi:diguanylate cyclase (GGDEF)-like protein